MMIKQKPLTANQIEVMNLAPFRLTWGDGRKSTANTARTLVKRGLLKAEKNYGYPRYTDYTPTEAGEKALRELEVYKRWDKWNTAVLGNGAGQ